MADENKASQLREKLLDLRNRERNTLEKYSEDLTLYLSNKLSDCNVPIHTIMEIAQFATLKAQIFVVDETKRQFNVWERQQRKSFSKSSRQRNGAVYMGEWISVKDRLPERFGKYLAVCENESNAVIRLYEGEWDSLKPVTHWQPLPELPKR